MSDLPKDWEAVNSKDGIYYWHTVTGEVTWKKPKQPTKPMPPPPPPLPNSPINPEPENDPYSYTDDYTQTAYPHYQPVQTCYQNVVLLEEKNTNDKTGEDVPPPIPARGIDNYENVDLLEKPSNANESSDIPTIDRYKVSLVHNYCTYINDACDDYVIYHDNEMSLIDRIRSSFL